KHKTLIVGLKITWSEGTCAQLRNDACAAVHKAHDSWFMKNVLIVSRKEEDSIASQRPAERESELLLLVLRLDIQFRIARVEAAVAEVIKCRAVKFVGAGFCDHIHNRAAASARFRRCGIRRHTEFLNH